MLFAQPCQTLLQPNELQPTRLHCLWNSPGKNTGVGCHSLLQGIFPTQGSNLGLLHYRQILYHLSCQKWYVWLMGFTCEYKMGKEKIAKSFWCWKAGGCLVINSEQGWESRISNWSWGKLWPEWYGRTSPPPIQRLTSANARCFWKRRWKWD